MTGRRNRTASAWDSKVYRSLRERYRRQRRRKRFVALLGLLACCWLFADNYNRMVKLKFCGTVNPDTDSYVMVGRTPSAASVATFTRTGAKFNPNFFGIAFAKSAQDILIVRRDKWGGEYRLLSADLVDRSDGKVYRKNLGRVDEACWTKLKRHMSEEWNAPDLRIIDEGKQIWRN